MDIAIALTVAFGALLLSVYRGVPIAYPLLAALGLMVGVYWRRGMTVAQLWTLMGTGMAQSLSVIAILLLVSLVVASWLIAGTVPTLVYYGLQLIHPQWFLVSAFMLTGTVSTLLGTSFGSAGTVGLALMIMARGAGVDEGWAAGAVMAGAYVGDRCSPLSSSAHLVAAITGTDIYRNLQNMVVTSGGAFALSLVIYGLASLRHPLTGTETTFMTNLPETFRVHPVTLLPAGLVVVLTLLRVPVRRTLVASTASAIVLAIGLQHQSALAILKTLAFGLQLPAGNPLRDLFQGGGLWTMTQVCAVVLVSTALAGLLAGMETFSGLGRWLARWPGKRGLFGGTLLAGTLTSAFGCTQTIAILLTQQIVQPRYAAAKLTQEQLAVDIENSAVVLAPLIPWNIASIGPATILLTGAGFIPYAVYLYLLPLLNVAFRHGVSRVRGSH